MTWLFHPIKSTDTNPGILDDNRTHHGKAVDDTRQITR